MATLLRRAKANICSGSRLPSICRWSSALGSPVMKVSRSCIAGTSRGGAGSRQARGMALPPCPTGASAPRSPSGRPGPDPRHRREARRARIITSPNGATHWATCRIPRWNQQVNAAGEAAAQHLSDRGERLDVVEQVPDHSSRRTALSTGAEAGAFRFQPALERAPARTPMWRADIFDGGVARSSRM